MLRLCRERSRHYPGRSVRHAFALCESAMCGNMQDDRAEVSPAFVGVNNGHSMCEITFPCSRDVKETSRENRWRPHPLKDQT